MAEAYYRVLGLTLLGLVAGDVYAGRWLMHAGQLYPYRHMRVFPLVSTAGLALEWAALVLAGAALCLGVARRAALWIAAAGVLVAVTQRYSNHATLTFIVLLFTALDPPATDADLTKPNIALVRWQLAIVYVSSGLNKVLAGFLDGESLSNLFLVLRDPLLPREWFAGAFQPPAVVVLSAGVVLFELSIPLVLRWWPRAGIALVALFHGGITLLMPGILPFGLIMLAMSVLYLPLARVSAGEVESVHGSAGGYLEHARTSRRSGVR